MASRPYEKTERITTYADNVQLAMDYPTRVHLNRISVQGFDPAPPDFTLQVHRREFVTFPQEIKWIHEINGVTRVATIEPHVFLQWDRVNITGTIPDYDGYSQVDEVLDPYTIIINRPFVGTHAGSGSIQLDVLDELRPGYLVIPEQVAAAGQVLFISAEGVLFINRDAKDGFINRRRIYLTPSSAGTYQFTIASDSKI